MYEDLFMLSFKFISYKVVRFGMLESSDDHDHAGCASISIIGRFTIVTAVGGVIGFDQSSSGKTVILLT